MRRIARVMPYGLLAMMLAAGCSARAPASYRATASTCYTFGVQAIKRHVTVTAEPRACAGLSHGQINQAMARALREAVGPEPKAIARHLADQDSAYVAHILSTVRPPGPVSPTVLSAPEPPTGLPLSLFALAAWFLTAAAGTYLFAGWLTAGGSPRPGDRPDRVVPIAVLSHFGLALAGLGTWVAFIVTGVPALAWAAVGVVVLVAGLGMGALMAALPEPGRTAVPASPGPASPGPARAGMPVTVIAIHGMFATATILLVLLAAIGAG